MEKRWDVLGLGCATVDDLLYVEAYPPADVKTRILRSERQCGGLTATALVAAARFGASCAYAGRLGDDEYWRYVLQALADEGIDVTLAPRLAGGSPIHSTIIIDTTSHTRNVFSEAIGETGPDDHLPSQTDIEAARVLLIDHHGVPGSIRAAGIARAAGIPVIADFERDNVPRFGELLELVDHLIIGQRFAAKITGELEPSVAVRRLAENHDVAVVTDGFRGSWYATDTRCASRQRAYRVEAVDTTGCGDVFHGVYAAALAQGLSLHDRMGFAAAAAALKARVPGSQRGIPSRAAVEAFLKARLSE